VKAQVPVAEIDAGPEAVKHDPVVVPPRGSDSAVKPPTPIAHLRVSPIANSEYSTDGEKTWKPVPDSGIVELPISEKTYVDVRNTNSQFGASGTFVEVGQEIGVDLHLLGAHIRPLCAGHKVEVMVDGKPAKVDKYATITFANDLSPTKRVTVEFLGDDVKNAPIYVTVEANKRVDVECIAR